jgi:hypothetical protein
LFFFCIFFAECRGVGTRQRPSLPSARLGTRQRILFFFLFAPKNFLQPSYSTCNYLFKFSPFFRPLAIFS